MCRWDITGKKYMKKLFIIIAILMACVTLTSFIINEQSSNKKDMGNEWIYYKSITAWLDVTESKTLYIYYKQGHEVRKYVCCEHHYSGDEIYNVKYFGMDIHKNDLYRSNECRDFRRNYRYTSENGLFAVFYFNADLPYMKN